jgi:hypothetical protein
MEAQDHLRAAKVEQLRQDIRQGSTVVPALPGMQRTLSDKRVPGALARRRSERRR